MTDGPKAKAPGAGASPLYELTIWSVGGDGGAKKYLSLPLQNGCHTVGRDVSADIRVDSKQVSRVHLTLRVDREEVWAEDSGSRNGIRWNGELVQRVRFTPKDVLAIPGFELRLQSLAPAPAGAEKPATERIGGGWDEFLDEGDLAPRPSEERGTLLARLLPREDGEAPPLPQQKTGTERREGRGEAPRPRSGRPFSREEGAGDQDDDEDDFDPRVVGPPLHRSLREGAQQLHAATEGRREVEVVVSTGEQVLDVAHLRRRQHYWWGGTPGLWRRQDVLHFPLVAFPHPGEVLLQHPQNNEWRLSGKSAAKLEPHHAGEFTIYCATWGDEVVLHHGGYQIEVRCVMQPLPNRPLDGWRALMPSPMLGLALLLSLVFHGVMVGIPLAAGRGSGRGDMLKTEVFVEYALSAPTEEVRFLAPVEPVAPPKLEPPPVKPKNAKPTPQPNAPAAPPKTSAAKPPPPDAPPPSKPRPSPFDSDDDEPPPPPASVQRKTVGLGDFKVTGTIGHMQELELDAGLSARGSRPLMRGIRGQGIVGKEPNNMGITPNGTLAKDDVSRTINSHTKEVYACYTALLTTYSSAEGRVELRWTVEQNGSVGKFMVLRDTVGSSGLIRCLRKVVRAWVFPQPKGGVAEVTYPFIFKRPAM